MADKIYNVLFVCTGNSARSILAESLLNGLAAHRFKAWSAGSHPKGEVHPLALQVLAHLNLPLEGLRRRAGTSSPAQRHLSSTSCSPSATTRLARSAPCGPVSL